MTVQQFMRFVFFAVPIFKHDNLRVLVGISIFVARTDDCEFASNRSVSSQAGDRITNIDDTIHWQLILIRSCVSSQIDLTAIRTTHAANTCEGEW